MTDHEPLEPEVLETDVEVAAAPTPARATDMGSKGVALTNWLVTRATGLLERKSSRRGFLIGSAMAGSAVAVAGCTPITSPGPPYTHITDCANSFCNDGYTEFCCSVNNGLNLCPPDSFAGGWWRADYSSFCNGTRYYIDCMQYCCGPATGYQNFCSGCSECRCANGCDTRRVYCNYFRYGQCHVNDQPTSGPIACRIVTCVPPYTVAEWNCSTTAAVDNSTAEHAGHCPPPPPPPVAAVLPSTGAAVQDANGRISVFVRGLQGHVHCQDFAQGAWSGWQDLQGITSSGIAAGVVGTTTYLVVRGADRQIYGNRRDGVVWSGWHLLPGKCSSDPVATSDAGGINVFVRGGDDAIYANRFNGSSWSGWIPGGGVIDSEPAVASAGSGAVVLARASDLRVHANNFDGGGFSGWVFVNEVATSSVAVATSGSGAFGFVRALDNSVRVGARPGSTWSWSSLGGAAASDPVAISDGSGVHVFVRGTDNAVHHNRRSGSSWVGWVKLGGVVTADPIVTTGPAGTFVFAQGSDSALWYGSISGDSWSGWLPLGGALAPVRATP